MPGSAKSKFDPEKNKTGLLRILSIFGGKHGHRKDEEAIQVASPVPLTPREDESEADRAHAPMYRRQRSNSIGGTSRTTIEDFEKIKMISRGAFGYARPTSQHKHWRRS
jgi:hypothetical protein